MSGTRKSSYKSSQPGYNQPAPSIVYGPKNSQHNKSRRSGDNQPAQSIVSGPKNSPHNKSSRSGDNQPDLSDDSKAQKRQYQDYQPVSSSMYSKQSRLFKRAKTKEDLNKDIIDLSQHSDNLSQHSYILSQLDINAGYQYIIHNNLE